MAKDLLTMPKVVLVTEFDEDSAKTFRREMSYAHRTGQKVIPVVIDSYGGDTYSLLSMVDTIRQAKLPVATIIEGKAMSCGAVLFTCGKDGLRFIAPNATIMIHDVSSTEGTRKTEEVKADAKETERINRKIYRIMDKNCGKERDFFWEQSQKKGRADWYITPREALKLNLANHIKVPTFCTSVRVETSLDYLKARGGAFRLPLLWSNETFLRFSVRRGKGITWLPPSSSSVSSSSGSGGSSSSSEADSFSWGSNSRVLSACAHSGICFFQLGP